MNRLLSCWSRAAVDCCSSDAAMVCSALFKLAYNTDAHCTHHQLMVHRAKWPCYLNRTAYHNVVNKHESAGSVQLNSQQIQQFITPQKISRHQEGLYVRSYRPAAAEHLNGLIDSAIACRCCGCAHHHAPLSCTQQLTDELANLTPLMSVH